MHSSYTNRCGKTAVQIIRRRPSARRAHRDQNSVNNKHTKKCPVDCKLCKVTFGRPLHKSRRHHQGQETNDTTFRLSLVLGSICIRCSFGSGLAQKLQPHGDGPLGAAHHDEAGRDGDDPIEQIGEELEGRRLVLIAEEGTHEDEETIRLVAAALGGIEDLLVDPRALACRGPRADNVQLLPLVHGGREEAGCDEQQENGAEPHEVLHTHLLGALEEDAATDSGQDQGQDDGDRQGAHVARVLEI
mmetsp:Transcript_97086/g.273868  ORF Transcript_97086/g.273868 Transcript_97086/m.273868 type:complete len:245 (+) Transcript_97086:76-810(+)